ncbi:MAG: UDP-N-acetylmuramoyl-L-alanine--D-glutamate ligase [Microgenomates group bacterium]
MSNFESVIAGKKVLIFGLGRQGGGSGDAEWLKQHGAIVKLSDKDLTLVPEGQNSSQIDWADIIIKNPGVPDSHELINYAKSLNKPVLTSIAVFVKYAQVTTIGVTGTRGKSTTVALITALIEKAFPGQVISGGNIAGTSCLSLFDKQSGKKYAVLELSSFQLHNFHELRVSPNIAVITNLYPDHLNRYTSMEEYQHDKEAICLYQQRSDHCFFNEQNPGSVSISRVTKAQRLAYRSSDCLTWQTSLPGLHNKENIAAMWAVGHELEMGESLARDVAASFSGVPYRQEVIAKIGEITYINDTTATTPTASIKALEAAVCPTIWITGGDTKNLPFAELLKTVKTCKSLKNIIILGSKNIPDYVNALKERVGDKIIGNAMSMKEALDMARSIASPGDAILLSPGFASFDLFKNEFDRGNQFNDLVKSYAQN